PCSSPRPRRLSRRLRRPTRLRMPRLRLSRPRRPLRPRLTLPPRLLPRLRPLPTLLPRTPPLTPRPTPTLTRPEMLAAALEHLVKGIVDHPDEVSVTERNTNRGELLEVRVHPEDLGRVIGRGGRSATALRTLVTALADGRRVRVDVVDTDS